jgi:hypothetical protein
MPRHRQSNRFNGFFLKPLKRLRLILVYYLTPR